MKIGWLKIIFLINLRLVSQGVLIAPQSGNPHPGAGLEVSFTDKGVLIPRVQLLKTDTLYPVVAGAEGLLVYNISDTNDVKPGFYYWSGGKWRRVLDEATVTAGAWILAGNTGTDSTHFLGTTDAKPLRIKTKDSLRMIVDTLGNVGIGVSQPGVRLDVGGAVRTETYTIRRVDLTNATSNYELAVGEEAIIRFTNQTNVSIPVAIPPSASLTIPVVYEIHFFLTSSQEVADLHIEPNGNVYTNEFWVDKITTPGPGAGSGEMIHSTSASWHRNSLSFDIGVNRDEFPPVHGKITLVYAGSSHKKLGYAMNGGTDYGFNVSQAVWNNTTTAWQWFGNFFALSSNEAVKSTISGFILIRRIM